MEVKKIKNSGSVRRLWGGFAGDKGSPGGLWSPSPHSTLLCHMWSGCVAGEVKPLSTARHCTHKPTTKKQTCAQILRLHIDFAFSCSFCSMGPFRMEDRLELSFLLLSLVLIIYHATKYYATYFWQVGTHFKLLMMHQVSKLFKQIHCANCCSHQENPYLKLWQYRALIQPF